MSIRDELSTKKGVNGKLPMAAAIAIRAVAAADRRIGKQDVTQEVREALVRAYERVNDVLEERDVANPMAVLKAAAMIADAIAGPLVQRAELSGPQGAPVPVHIDISGGAPNRYLTDQSEGAVVAHAYVANELLGEPTTLEEAKAVLRTREEQVEWEIQQACNEAAANPKKPRKR